jgi:hypothetical protein
MENRFVGDNALLSRSRGSYSNNLGGLKWLCCKLKVNGNFRHCLSGRGLLMDIKFVRHNHLLGTRLANLIIL